MKLNTLRIEPHRVKPDTSKEYYAPKDSVVFWRIWIDDDKVAEQAYPFDEKCLMAQLETDANYPHYFDDNDVVIGRVNDYIIWLPKYFDNYFSKIFCMFLFDAHHYDSACQTAITISQKIDRDTHILRTPSQGQVLDKTFCLNWIKYQSSNLGDKYVIYREPASRLDTTGSTLCRKMQQAIKCMTDFTVCDPPHKQVEIRLGLDDTEFKEAVWHVGKVAGQYAVWFEQNPTFPLWIRSAAFERVFIQETFVKELE